MEAIWNSFELLEVLALAQEQLDRVEGLQEEMLVLLVVLQDPNEQFVALLLDADAERVWILEQLRKDRVRVAQSRGVDVLVLKNALHQRVQFAEEPEAQKEGNVVFVPRQVQIETGDQGHDECVLVELLWSFVLLLVVVLQQEVDPVEDALAVVAVGLADSSVDSGDGLIAIDLVVLALDH